MRKIYRNLIGTVALMLFFSACSDILEEKPRSIYEPGYFTTEEGVKGIDLYVRSPALYLWARLLL